jgi:hypothetical protein
MIISHIKMSRTRILSLILCAIVRVTALTELLQVFRAVRILEATKCTIGYAIDNHTCEYYENMTFETMSLNCTENDSTNSNTNSNSIIHYQGLMKIVLADSVKLNKHDEYEEDIWSYSTKNTHTNVILDSPLLIIDDFLSEEESSYLFKSLSEYFKDPQSRNQIVYQAKLNSVMTVMERISVLNMINQITSRVQFVFGSHMNFNLISMLEPMNPSLTELHFDESRQSVLIYVNTVDNQFRNVSSGHTRFPILNLEIMPIAGRLVSWRNDILRKDGVLFKNDFMKHHSEIVALGHSTKYILLYSSSEGVSQLDWYNDRNMKTHINGWRQYYV